MCIHVSITFAKASVSKTRKREKRERERPSVSARLSRGTSNHYYNTFSDCSHFRVAWLHHAKPIEIFHPDLAILPISANSLTGCSSWRDLRMASSMSGSSSRSSGSSPSCISQLTQPPLKSGMLHSFPPTAQQQNFAQFDHQALKKKSGWCDPDIKTLKYSEMVPQWLGWWVHGVCFQILSGHCSVQRRG